MNPWILAVATALALTACQPADVKVKSVKDRLEAGEVVEFTEPGYRRPSCSERAPDWADLIVSNEAERERVVLKSQSAILSPGRHSCYRIGTQLNLKINNKNGGSGQIRIRKLALVMLSKLQQRHMKGRFFSKADDFNKYKDDLQRFRMRPDHEGIVTIVEFDYVNGTAADQKRLEEKEQEKNTGDGYEETTEAGQRVGECRNNNVWSEILVPQEFHAPILNGQIKSWYRLGDFSCLTHGQEADVKTAIEGASSGKVRVTKLKIFKTSALSPERFNLPGYDYELLKTRILQENQNRPQDWIVVFDVESLSGGNGGGATEENCRPARLTAMAGADVNARRFTTVAPANHCLKAGDLLILEIPVENGPAVEYAARVISTQTETGINFVTVEKIGQGGQ